MSSGGRQVAETGGTTIGTIVSSGGMENVSVVGTGGTTGRPKGVMLTNANLETMTALTLMGYPFEGRPVYLALAPLTHAAGSSASRCSRSVARS